MNLCEECEFLYTKREANSLLCAGLEIKLDIARASRDQRAVEALIAEYDKASATRELLLRVYFQHRKVRHEECFAACAGGGGKK